MNHSLRKKRHMLGSYREGLFALPFRSDRATPAHAAKLAALKKAIGELRVDVQKTGMDLS